ncbi:MAG: hypothetical protein IT213_17010 [Cytophagales bacterium]|nr:hypothetical protein [Cytophagales bacterium]
MIRSDRIKFRDDLEAEYGIHISENDELLPILHFVFHSVKEVNESRVKQESALNELMGKINRPVYNFGPGEAWQFQLAASLKWLFIGVSVVLLSWISLTWWSRKNDLEEAERIIQSSVRINSHLLNNVKEDRDGFMFLEFTEAKGNSIKNFIEYEKINSKTIRVYLGQKK